MLIGLFKSCFIKRTMIRLSWEPTGEQTCFYRRLQRTLDPGSLKAEGTAADCTMFNFLLKQAVLLC